MSKIRVAFATAIALAALFAGGTAQAQHTTASHSTVIAGGRTAASSPVECCD